MRRQQYGGAFQVHHRVHRQEVDSRPPARAHTGPPAARRSIKDTIGQCLVCATDGMGRAVERIGDKAHNTPRPRRLWFALLTRRLFPRKSVVRRLIIIIAASFASPASHTHSRPGQAVNTLFLFPLAGWHHKTDPQSFPLPRPTTTRGQASNGSNSRPRRPRQATVGEQQADREQGAAAVGRAARACGQENAIAATRVEVLAVRRGGWPRTAVERATG
jgi:hypothetical protein